MNPPRSTPHLSEPPPPQQLRDQFPDLTAPSGSLFFRTHHHGRAPWWFSSDGGGRFDLSLPNGTCYLAEDEVTTLLESWGGLAVVPSYLADARDISALRLDRDRRLADLTSNKAIQFGITAEAFSTTEYPRTQLWAAALRAAGYDGIRYWARHDVEHTHACLALFGAGGTADYVTDRTNVVSTRGDLLRRLHAEAGITVMNVPPATR